MILSSLPKALFVPHSPYLTHAPPLRYSRPVPDSGPPPPTPSPPPDALRHAQHWRRVRAAAAGRASAVKRGLVGNRAWGLSMLGRQHGLAMARHGLEHLRRWAPIASVAAQRTFELRRRRKAYDEAQAALSAQFGLAGSSPVGTLATGGGLSPTPPLPSLSSSQGKREKTKRTKSLSTPPRLRRSRS